MTIPTLPSSLPAGYVVQPGDLTSIAYGCTFLLTKPITRVHQATTGESVTTSGTQINWDTVDFDTDGMWNSGTPSVLSAQTPGFYKIRYLVQLTSTSNIGNAYAFITTGSNNPAGSGVTYQCWGSYAWGVSSYSMGASGILPSYLYAGDKVQVIGYPHMAATTISTDVASFMSLELVSI